MAYLRQCLLEVRAAKGELNDGDLQFKESESRGEHVETHALHDASGRQAERPGLASRNEVDRKQQCSVFLCKQC
jgi:hypothetical protein